MKNKGRGILAVPLVFCIMVFVAFYAHGISKYKDALAEGTFSFPVLFYLIVFAVIMGLGALFYKKKKK